MTNPLHALLGTQSQRLAEPLPAQRARILWYLVLLVLGALVSLCGCFVQTLWSPFGLILALLATGAVFYGGLRVTGTKLGAGVPMIGWFLVLLVMLAPRPEGDFVLAATGDSYAYLFGGALIGVICATLPTRTPFTLGIPRQRD
jgi:tetrahydromethanopterin S-methyltransferase subunit C